MLLFTIVSFVFSATSGIYGVKYRRLSLEFTGRRMRETIRKRNKRQKIQQQQQKRDGTCACVYVGFLGLKVGLLNGTKLACLF